MLSEHVHGVVRVPVQEAVRMIEDAFSHVLTYHCLRLSMVILALIAANSSSARNAKVLSASPTVANAVRSRAMLGSELGVGSVSAEFLSLQLEQSIVITLPAVSCNK